MAALDPTAKARPRGVLRRPTREGASEVLGAFLMVAITILLVAVLFVLVSVPASPPTETSTIVFSVGDMTRNASNNSRNDTIFTVSAKLGNGDIVWNDSSFHVYVQDAVGNVLMDHNVTRDDQNGNGRVDTSDRVLLRGFPDAYHTAHLLVIFHNRIVGDVPIP